MHYGVGALFVLAALAGGAVLAQGKPSLRILVDGVTREAEACGIRQAAIESTALKALNLNQRDREYPDYELCPPASSRLGEKREIFNTSEA